MLGRASYNNIASNANEEDDPNGLNLAEDMKGRKNDDSAVTVTASISKEEDDLTWTDNYFADHQDIIAAFDFHHDEHAHSQMKSTLCLLRIFLAVSFSLTSLMLVVPATYFNMAILAVVCWWFGFPIILVTHVPPIASFPHLAVTATSLFFVESPATGSRFLGSTLQIPLEAIDAIEINSAANVAIRILSSDWTDYVVSGAPRGLCKIRRYKLHTEWKEEIVKDGQDCNGIRLEIKYLLEPYRFKKLVMSLKEQQQVVKLDKKEEESGSAVVYLVDG